ncbi:MAG: hypothetical protein AB7J63_14155, partial [Vicinamibacterales bacterium]
TSELIDALKKEVHILNHLITKIEPAMVDYRPTEKQRSTLELLKYMAFMGPVLVKSALAGSFDQADWVARSATLEGKGLTETAAAIAAQAGEYEALLANVPDEKFRADVELFGRRTKVGPFIIGTVLGGHAAYRTQLFCYLKACGRTELSTMNLWAGMDAPAAATT